MEIQSVQAKQSGFIVNGKLHVPDDLANRDRQAIGEWVAEGGAITPYVPPPPPTDSERIDAAFPQTDVARVLFEAIFELSNRIIALEGGAPITKAQLRDWLMLKLP